MSGIDLHAHSSASDGTDTPADMVRCAADAGLDVVAITDHDTTAGWESAARAAHQSGVRLVRGAELSVAHHGRSVHLLAYLFDPGAPELRRHRHEVREARLVRAHRMVGLLARDFPITWDDVAAQTGAGATVGRPHIADALVAAGVVEHRDDAFATMLAGDSPYYVPHHVMPAAATMELVRAAGGVPVLAHPAAVLRGRVLSDEEITDLVEHGLAGLEVEHRDHDDQGRLRLQALADRLRLVATGGSDYHGRGKQNRLGENTTTPEAFERLLALASGVPLV